MGARRQKDWEATIYSKYENSVTLLEYIVCVVAHSHKTKQNKKMYEKLRHKDYFKSA